VPAECRRPSKLFSYKAPCLRAANIALFIPGGKMKTLKTLCTAVALAAGLGCGAVWAQDRHDHGRGNDRGWQDRDHGRDNGRGRGPDRRDDRRDDRRHESRGAGPDHNFHRGGRLPAYYRSRQYVVNDWRGHHLSAPPRGYQWVQTGSDYVLVAIATGIITQILLSQ
jgi:Ni/Co efflux regulator RcnB